MSGRLVPGWGIVTAEVCYSRITHHIKICVSGILKTGKMRASLLLPSAVGARQFSCIIGFYFLIVSDFLLFLFL